MTWRYRRTPRTPEPKGMMRLCGLVRMGNLGSLTCKGGYQTKWYQRLWPRRGQALLLAYFHQNVCLFFQRGGPIARACYAWVKTHTAGLASASACLHHVRPWIEESFQIIYKSCRRLMGRQDEGSAASFTGLRMEITPACLHTVGK
jgi:hypothetical protein